MIDYYISVVIICSWFFWTFVIYTLVKSIKNRLPSNKEKSVLTNMKLNMYKLRRWCASDYPIIDDVLDYISGKNTMSIQAFQDELNRKYKGEM